MSIYRVKKDANYVVVNRTALNDAQLSWRAKGLLAYMLSMPDDWTFYNEELSQHSKDGLTTLKACVKELKQCGYLVRKPVKDDKGKISGWETHVYEIPEVAKPQGGETIGWETHRVDSRPLLSTELKLSIDKTNYSNEFESFWSIYPKKIEKKQAYTKFKTAIKNHPIDIIVSGTKRYAQQVQKTEKQFIKHPATFLNNESFIDGFEEVEQPKPIQPKEERKSVLAGMWGDED